MTARDTREGFEYQGTELEVFQHAENWKRYFREQLEGLVRGNVLEVGAGLGATTSVLRELHHSHWTCLEPDGRLAGKLRARFADAINEGDVDLVPGALEDLDPAQLFDTILYVDVLEHLEDDRGELERAARALKSGGVLAVLSPAHQWLYTAFDRAIGHYRRYSRSALLAVGPLGCEVVQARYLDSVGMLASIANRFILRSASPSTRQILTWDRFLVPLSRRFDGILGYRLGKSILVAWRR